MYKEHDVVMLPTKEKAIYHGQPWLHGNKLHYHTGSVDGVTEQEIASGYCKPQHLYILSDDKSKEGDWFYNGEEILQCSNVTDIIIDTQGQWSNIETSKKIIATTDKSLIKGLDSFSAKPVLLPQIPKSFINYFIEQHNKGNVITDVNVEYDTIEVPFVTGDGFEFVLKVNPDNTINIQPIKNSWSRSEMVEIAKQAFNAGAQYANSFKQGIASKPNDIEWIEQNLK